MKRYSVCESYKFYSIVEDDEAIEDRQRWHSLTIVKSGLTLDEAEKLANKWNKEQEEEQSMITVNVWFGAEAYASVSEEFASTLDAIEFASKYSVKEYPDACVRLFTEDGDIIAIDQLR